jgi:hypothetical protein
MRTDRGVVLTKHPLAVVVLLAFITGGAAAVILNYPPRRPAGYQESAEKAADAARGAAPETDASAARAAEVGHAEEGATSDEFGDPVERPEEVSDEAEDGSGGAGVEVGKPSGVARVRSGTNGDAVKSPRAPAAYVRVSRAQASPAGRGVAGRTVGGVKKTGQGVKKAGAAIGKTFGKIGGVFND